MDLFLFKVLSRMKLSHYIKCYKKQIWPEDTMVPPLWISWYQIFRKIRGSTNKEIFVAICADEYARKVKPFTPHLNETDLGELYDQIMNETHIEFAGPPLLNEKFCHMMQSGKESNQQFYLYGRIQSTNNHYTILSDLNNIKFKEKAIHYAKENWPEILRPDLSFYRAVYSFDDPAVSSPSFGGCKHRFSINMALDEPYDNLDYERKDKPAHTRIDDHIVMVSYDNILSGEIIPPAPYSDSSTPYPCAHPSPICVYDGSTLGDSSCKICKKEFTKTTAFQFADIPIGNVLFDYLKTNENQIREFNKLSSEITIIPNKELLDMARS
jgi:hypothetical protein